MGLFVQSRKTRILCASRRPIDAAPTGRRTLHDPRCSLHSAAAINYTPSHTRRIGLYRPIYPLHAIPSRSFLSTTQRFSPPSVHLSFSRLDKCQRRVVRQQPRLPLSVGDRRALAHSVRTNLGLSPLELPAIAFLFRHLRNHSKPGTMFYIMYLTGTHDFFSIYLAWYIRNDSCPTRKVESCMVQYCVCNSMCLCRFLFHCFVE